MSSLTTTQKKQLRAEAHHLEPVVQLGHQGVTEGLLAEINKALDIHELIKVKFVANKEEKQGFSEQISQNLEAELVGLIGNICILYKQNPEPKKRKIKLSR